MLNSLPSTGTGRRRPLRSKSPSVWFWHLTATMRPPSTTASIGLVRKWMMHPSASAASISSA